MVPLHVFAIALAALVAAATGWGVYQHGVGYRAGADAEFRKHGERAVENLASSIAATDDARSRELAALASLDAIRDRLGATERDLQKRLAAIRRANPVAVGCVLDADRLRLVTEATAAANAAAGRGAGPDGVRSLRRPDRAGD